MNEREEGKIYVLLDGPPEQKSGRFVEVENSKGESVSCGEWKNEGQYWVLVIDDPSRLKKENIILKKALAYCALGCDSNCPFIYNDNTRCRAEDARIENREIEIMTEEEEED